MQKSAGALFFFSVFITGFSSQLLHAETCSEKLREIITAESRESEIAGLSAIKRIAKTTVGVFIKPYTFPIKLARAALWGEEEKPLWAKRVDFVKEGAQAVAGYLIYGLVPDAFTLSIAEYHSETDDEFWKISKKDLVVLVDGFEEKTFLDKNRKVLLQIIAQEKQREGWNVVYLSPNNPYELAMSLNELEKTRGPISRLDIYSHGTEKYGFLIRDQWVGMNPDSTFFRNVNPVMGENALIRINACLVGKNKDFLNRLGAALMPDGGIVYASKLVTVPSGTAELSEYLVKKDLPSAIDRLQDILVGKAFNLGLLFYLQGQDFTYGEGWMKPEWHPIEKVIIPRE